ncbi:MAG: hypothetical protein EZS28_040892 [Streblomastix strix]|uniref:Uncharacterized protein n=1 Tax=Streblomastix strix TaxID=222440 RepID=A0A5J4U0S9_9EUKA|nr:MAG: hypothetical protein EZS28_040892 [Streblomastix strix]
MGRPSKNKESRNGRKSGPFKKRALVQWAGYATNSYVGHQFEPRSRLARRATGFRRILVRSTVSAHCSDQRTHTTHRTVITRLGIVSVNIGRHHRSAAVLEVIQCAARAPQLLQHTEIPAADKQLLPPLQTIDALASGFQLQTLQFWELGILTIQHILEGNLTEAVIDTVSGLVLALRQAERANMAIIRLFSMINAHLFDGNNNSVMSHANLATMQRQIGIQQLTSGQNVANVQGNLNGQQGADSEGSQTQRQNTMARNFHTVIDIDMKSVGRDMNSPPLEAKINLASFNRQRDYWASKSYVLKYIGKPGAGQHLLGYGEGQIEVQEVIPRHTRGETISIAD